MSSFVLLGACMYLVCVLHVCVFASVFYVFVAAIWQNKQIIGLVCFNVFFIPCF